MKTRIGLIAAGLLLVAWPLLPLEMVGTDDRAVQAIEAAGHQPWASPLHEPSERAEPWLFALQAAIGVGLLALALRKKA